MFKCEQGPGIKARALIDFSFKSSLTPCFFLQELPLRLHLGYILVIANCSSGFCSLSSTRPILSILKCSLEYSLVQWHTSCFVLFFHNHHVYATALCLPSELFISPSSGQFLWVNSSSFSGPWVLSPWLQGSQGPCSLDMAVFLHPKQSGQYTIWLIERDKPPLALVSTNTLPRMTG